MKHFDAILRFFIVLFVILGTAYFGLGVWAFLDGAPIAGVLLVGLTVWNLGMVAYLRRSLHGSEVFGE